MVGMTSEPTIFDGFPLEGMIGIAFYQFPRDIDWPERFAAAVFTRGEWFARIRKPTHYEPHREVRVRLPDAVIEELRRANGGGYVFRWQRDEPDTAERMQGEINAAAERVAQRYVMGPGSASEVTLTTQLTREQMDELYGLLGGSLGPPASFCGPDSAQPDTSQPYFLDLLARIDAITEGQA